MCMHMKATLKILLFVTNFYVNGIVAVKVFEQAFLGNLLLVGQGGDLIVWLRPFFRFTMC